MCAWILEKLSNIPEHVKKTFYPKTEVLCTAVKVPRTHAPLCRTYSTIGSPEIQELDGGFFEKFGSLLKEQQDDLKEAEEITVDEDGFLHIAEPTVDEEADEDGDESGGGTSGDSSNVVAAMLDSDSEPEDINTEDLITNAMGWNIEELYSEVLYEILHVVGCDASVQEEQATLFSYMQEAFKLDDEKHNSLIENARAKEAPNILLNVEVIEAKDLAPKDANGLSDPFCTLYLTSSSGHRYNTSVKAETLAPIWEEHFSLPVQNPSEDVLCVEVWDFDPAETVRDKIGKFSGVKGVRGLRKLMKEIAITASTGKHDNELVGSAQMPLRNIPASGMTYWCTLEKRSKAKKQGDLKVKLAFSSEKNRLVATQEHRHLLKLIVLHELDSTKVEPYHWTGKFSDPAQTILTQHLVQCGMCSLDVFLAEWLEFVSVHVDNPLSFQVFAVLLAKLTRPIKTGLVQAEEEKLFWDATKKLLPSCFNGIRKLRKFTPSDKHTLNQVSSILSVLSQLLELQPPEGYDLFPPSVYGWLSTSSEEPNCDILATLTEAVRQGTEDWFCHILENNNMSDPTEEAKLNQQIKIVQLVRTDLQKAIEFHDKIFQQIMRFPYARTIYTIYETKVSELAEQVVNDVCETLRPLKFNDNLQDGIYDNDPLTMGTTLFELYLVLQRFAVLGTGLCPAEVEGLKIRQFHTWFRRGVAQWLDIALYKALQRIDKAVDLDQLEPVDNTVKHSSSAVDSLAIFYQIKVFWQQLAWPDVEGSYTFVAKIIDDICRCSVFYADKMSKKVDNLGETESVYEKKFEVTNEWCLAINNIEYVRRYIPPFVSELGMEDILASLADFGNATAAAHCKQTLQLVIDNAVETVGNKIHDLLDTVAQKMMPSISRFLLEGAELINQDNNRVDRLMKYLDDNLTTLHSQLNADNFNRIVDIVWETLAKILHGIVEANIEKRRPPSFFSNLHETLTMLIGFFSQGDERRESADLDHIEHLLLVNRLETPQLIHQFHVERLQEQSAVEGAGLGLLTVRLQRVDDLLRIEILNARNLRPMDANGSCDPYVKVHLLPEEKFAGTVKPRTKTHKKNLFPLFDETFTIHLTNDQQHLQDALLMFVIKDQDFLGSNEFLGEAFVSFCDIPKTEMTTGLEQLEQLHLKLNKPNNLASDSLKALEHRPGDRLAKDFVKKQKAKFPH